MSEEIEFLVEKPETLVKYGKIFFMNENNIGIHPNKLFGKSTKIVEKNTEEILNIILPPIYFKNENSEKCYQKIVTVPAKKSDVS